MYVEYSANNSGGSWWLSLEDWKALEEAGWDVKWEESHFLGAAATRATLKNVNMAAAIESFESATGEDSSALGCGCCGPPHNFTSYGDNDEYLEYYSPDAPTHGDRYV